MTIGVASSGRLGPGSTYAVGDLLVVVPAQLFTLTANAPQVILPDVVTVPAQTFTLTTTTPIVLYNEYIVVPAQSFTLTATPPTVEGDELVFVPQKLFTLTVTAPLADENTTVIVPGHTFNFTTVRPRVINSTDYFVRTINAAHTDEVFIILLTISHPSLITPIRVSSDPTQLLPIAQVRGTISNGDEYIFYPFEFVFPNQEEKSSPTAQISISNVSREISTVLNELSSAPEFDIQVVLASTPDVVELSLPDFKLMQTTWNSAVVTGAISVEYFDQEPYPAGRFTPAGFPGLFAS